MEGRGEGPKVAPVEKDAVFNRPIFINLPVCSCASVEDAAMSKATKGSHCNLCK